MSRIVDKVYTMLFIVKNLIDIARVWRKQTNANLNTIFQCLTEIAAVTVPHYDEMFVTLFSQTMTQMEAMLPVDTNIREAYSNGHDAEQQFIQDLALFFCAYLKGS